MTSFKMADGILRTWWRHQMETFSALLALCAGNSPVSGEFPAQRPVARSFDVFFDLRLNKRLSKQSRGWWFETHRAHCDVTVMNVAALRCFPRRKLFLRLIVIHEVCILGIWRTIDNTDAKIIVRCICRYALSDHKIIALKVCVLKRTLGQIKHFAFITFSHDAECTCARC